MRKAILILVAVFFVLGCNQQFTEREIIKDVSKNGLNEYCKTTLTPAGKTYEIKDFGSCVIQGTEAVVKINVVIFENGTYNNKTATVVSEKGADKKWTVKSVLIE